MSENLKLYEHFRAVPDIAKKPINAGRLKGMTDISPMWRIKSLTEEFGACGFGWVAPIVKTWLDEANGEIVIGIEIELKVCRNGVWSLGITGIGGSKLKAKEKDGYFVDDDAYKKAYTDALSVACKALGFGACVYEDSDPTKYEAGKIGKGTGRSKGSQKEQGSILALETKGKTKWQIANEMIKGSKYTLASLEKWQEKQFGEVKPINKLTDEEFALMVEVIQNSIGG